MPLLSLPVELLSRIVHFTTTSDQGDLDDCHCGDISHSPTEQATSPSCTPSAVTTLAHTCHFLRALSLPLMYTSVIAYTEHMPSLHAQLTSCEAIALLVHRVTIFVTDGATRAPVREILSSCVNLQHLCLDGKDVFGPWDLAGFHPALLQHVSPASQLSFGLRGFMYGGILPYLKHLSSPSNEFRGLHTIRIEDAAGERRLAGYVPGSALPGLAPNPATQLTSVRNLIFQTAPFEMLPWQTQCMAGAFIAQTMPNVEVLNLDVDAYCALAMVHKYVTLGTNLTDLTVHFDADSAHMCCAIAGLAPKLRRLVSHGGTICQELFEDTEWACVVEFEMLCEVRCHGVQPDLLREALVGLVSARSEASIKIATNDGRELVCLNQPGKVDCVVELEEFEGAEEIEEPEWESELDWDSELEGSELGWDSELEGFEHHSLELEESEHESDE